MKNNLKTIVFTASIVLMASCSSSEIKEPDTVTPVTPTKTTYEKDIKTLINNSCATSACHDAVSPQAGLPLTNFTQVKNAAQNGNLITRINSNSNPMPPSGKNQTIISMIDKWKNDVYLEK